MKVLIITSTPDPHVDMVVRYLSDTEVAVFDPLRFPFEEEITYDFVSGKMRIYGARNVLSDADVVWYRKPYFVKMKDMPVPEEFKEIAHISYINSVKWLYATIQDAFWVSDVWAILRANNKALQMNLASELGFHVPDTLITSSPTEAKKFLAKHEHVITKPLYQEFVEQDGIVKLMYTTRLNDVSSINFDGLVVSPAIFQDEVRGVDIRVTVIGEKVFPCKIIKTGVASSLIDWRICQFDDVLDYKIDKDFNDDMATLCVQLVKALGLRYGAIDLILDNKGDYNFLEINPNGQWGFIEQNADIPLSEAMANLFRNRC